jgi:hypothetical protein
MLSFDPQTSVSVDRILAWAEQEPDRLRLFPNDRVLIRFYVPDPKERLASIEQILDWLELEPGHRKVADGKDA